MLLKVVTWVKSFNLVDLSLVLAPFFLLLQTCQDFGKLEVSNGPNGYALVEPVCSDIKHQDMLVSTEWEITINIETIGLHIALLNHTTDGKEDKSSVMHQCFIEKGFCFQFI